MIIDIIFAVIIILACLKGYQKGLIVGVFSVIAFIIGLAAALKLSAVAAFYLKDSISISAKWLPFISFIIVFFSVVLLVRWGAKLVEKSIQLVLLGWVNRLGGIILFAALYIIIFSIFLFYAEKLHLLEAAAISSSKTYTFIQPWGPKVINSFGQLIPVFNDMFTQLENFFSSIPAKN